MRILLATEHCPLATLTLQLCGGLLGCAHGIEEAEELFDPSDAERVVDAFADAHQRKASSALLAGDVRSNQRADSCRIHIGDVGEINDQRAGGVGTHHGLELEHRGHDQCSVKAENALSLLGSRLVFNAKGL